MASAERLDAGHVSQNEKEWLSPNGVFVNLENYDKALQ